VVHGVPVHVAVPVMLGQNWFSLDMDFTYAHKNGSTTTIYKRSKLGSHAHHYKVTGVYYRHSSSPDFMTIITTLNGKGNCVAQSVYMYPVVSDYLECQLVTLVYLQITEVNCNT